MASTFSDRLKLELMATGANANTWGTNTNNNLEVVDAFAAGYLSKSVAGSANITLSTANASDTAESSNKTIELTGALTGDIVVFIPAVESEYNFFNNTTGSQTVTIAATGYQAAGVVITQGAKTTVYCDGASNYNVEIISSTDAATGLQTGTVASARLSGAYTGVTGLGTLTGLTVDGDATLTGASYNAAWDKSDNALEFADNAKASFGDGADMIIFHDGTDSIIKEQGGGDLIIRSEATIKFQNEGGTETYANFKHNDSVELFTNNTKVFQTLAAGVEVLGELRATGDVTAFYSSDVALKENIHNISSPMEKVQNLNGVLFDWKQNYIDAKGGEDGYYVRKTDVGVIAQDVEKVLPEVVGTRPNGVKAVKYDRLCALLIECVKDLQTQVNDLKKGK